MKAIKRIAVAALALILCIAVGACGNSSSTSPGESKPAGQAGSGDSSTPSGSDAATVRDPGKVKLTYTYWGSTYEKDVITKAMQKFMDETGYTVELIHIPSDYETKLSTMIAGNDAPDAGYLGPPTAYKWFDDGILYDIKEFFLEDDSIKEEDYLPGAIGRRGDGIIGIMNSLESYAIWYNKAAFAEAGITDVPLKPEDAWTWDEFVEIAKRLTIDNNGRNALDPNFDPNNIKQYGFHMNFWSGPFEALLLRNGTQYYPNMQDECAIGTKKFNEVFQNVADLINVHHVMPSPTALKSIPSSSVALQSRRYAMTLDGQWVCNDYAPVEDLDYGICQIPKMTDTTSIYSSPFGVIFADTEFPRETWELTRFITDPVNCIEIFRDGLWMPTKVAYYTEEDKISMWASESRARVKGYREVLIDPLMTNAQVSGEVYVKNFGDIGNIMYPALDQVWSGEKTVDQVMQEIMPELQPLLQGVLK